MLPCRIQLVRCVVLHLQVLVVVDVMENNVQEDIFLPEDRIFAKELNSLRAYDTEKERMLCLTEAFNKAIWNERSLKRLQTWLEKKDIACISSKKSVFQNQSELIATSLVFNRELKSKLLLSKYGILSPVFENNFFVVNLNNDTYFFDTIFALAVYYNEDSFLYKMAGNNTAYKVGLNKTINKEIGLYANVRCLISKVMAMYMHKDNHNDNSKLPLFECLYSYSLSARRLITEEAL